MLVSIIVVTGYIVCDKVSLFAGIYIGQYYLKLDFLYREIKRLLESFYRF